MIQEDKQLLLKDLCARLPYGIKCAPTIKSEFIAYCTIDGIKRDINGGLFVELTDRDIDGNALASTSVNGFNYVKPYLRPMSSMTEKERETFNYLCESRYFYSSNISGRNYDYYDWLNEHHFDYRGLIEKGLAIEAPEDMYKIE